MAPLIWAPEGLEPSWTTRCSARASRLLLSRFLPVNSLGPSHKAAAHFGSRSPRCSVPQEMGQKKEIQKCLTDMLSGIGFRADYSPTLESLEQPKSHGRDGEEVHRCDCLPMVLQKREPSFRGFWISRSASHPTGNRSLRNIESEHQKFPVDSWRVPSRVLGNHPECQIADFLRNSLSPNHSPRP